MSDRMKRLIEAGEVLRGYDIEIGRRLERERIIKLLISEEILHPDDETSQAIIELIREES